MLCEMVLINESQKNPWDHEPQASSSVCLRGDWTLNTVALFILIPNHLLHVKPGTRSALKHHKGFAMGQIHGPFPRLQFVWSILFFLYTFHTDTFPISQSSLVIINYLCDFWQSIALPSKSLMKATLTSEEPQPFSEGGDTSHIHFSELHKILDRLWIMARKILVQPLMACDLEQYIWTSWTSALLKITCLEESLSSEYKYVQIWSMEFSCYSIHRISPFLLYNSCINCFTVWDKKKFGFCKLAFWICVL